MSIIHTSGRRRKTPQKPTAEQRRLALEWEAIVSQSRAPLERGAIAKNVTVAPPKAKRGRKASTPVHVSAVPLLTVPQERSVRKHASHVTPGGEASARPSPQYTGDAVLGISTLHKSNAVPVFSREDAVDIAKMRRG
jgi:hypothetical protein